MPNQPPSWPAAEQHGRKDTQMNYLEVFYAVGTQLSRLVSGRLLTETQIKAASAHAVGKYFADFLPEPNGGMRVRFQLIVTFGVSSLSRLLAVSHTYRPNGVRVISARRVTRLERKVYEEG